MPKGSNWNEVKQGLINDLGGFKKEFLTTAMHDIVARFEKKGLPASDLEVSNDRSNVSYEAKNADDLQEGKIYFDEVYAEISDPRWMETL